MLIFVGSFDGHGVMIMNEKIDYLRPAVRLSLLGALRRSLFQIVVPRYACID